VPMIQSAPKALRPGALGIAAVVAMVAGLLQAPLTVLTQQRVVLYFDDAAVLILFALCLLRLARARPLPVLLTGLWLVVMIVALLFSPIDFSTALTLCRQVAMPALLVLVGITLRADELRLVGRAAIIIGLINAAYISLELFGIRLLDPTKLLAASSENIAFLINGLPGYYSIELGDGLRPFLRSGGLFLNPPICGVATGLAFALLWHFKSFPLRRLALLVLLVATVATVSRGGLMILLLGALLPLLVVRLGRIASFAVVGVTAVITGNEAAGQGGSEAHASGLVIGLQQAMGNPFGMGFGRVGNLLGSGTNVDGSESLLAIAFSAAGWIPLVLVVALIVRFWLSLTNGKQEWPNGIALAAVLAALLSETAGALNATIALWLCVGYALGAISRSSKYEGVAT
jgi:hypothetical protein